jgi:hypothetical protein
VYSVTGLPGSDYHGIPYLSPAMARRVLERSVLLRGRYRVPCPEDHFASLAYHAIYHKGERSGLPETEQSGAPAGVSAEHDYAAILADLAERISLSVPITLTGLDAHLAATGLRPPLDTLEKLGESNAWLRRRVDEEFGPADAGLPGLAVFVVRERAAALLDRVRTELLREGWEPLETVHLDPAAASRVGARVRGGNWGAGPWPVSGGGPTAYVIGYDLSAAVGDGVMAADPDRVTASKLAIRRRLLADQPGGAAFNPLHSSDNPRQALDYLELLDDPALVERLRRRISDLRADMVFPYPVVELLPSMRRRAVTAVVAHPEFGESVCKLFYPSARRFLLRELRARTDFAAVPEVPALLETGGNWLLSPRYQDTGAHLRRQLPGSPHAQLTPSASRALARLARELHGRNAYLLDLTPLNLVSDASEGLKVLDWEFLQDFPGARPPLTASPTVLGRADGFPDVDTPLGVSAQGHSVVTALSPMLTGVPASVLLAGSGPAIALAAEPGMVAAFLLRGARTAVKRARSTSRRTVRQIGRAVVSLLERRAARGAG